MGKNLVEKCRVSNFPNCLTLETVKLIENDLSKLSLLPPLKPFEKFKEEHPNVNTENNYNVMRAIEIIHNNDLILKDNLKLSYKVTDLKKRYSKNITINSKTYTSKELNNL